MDSQLKALKVAELKRVLTDAGISVTARATKADLIARVLDSQDAQRVYRTIYGLPQPPAVSVPQPASVPTPTPTPTLPPAPAPITTPPTTLATADVQEPVAPQPDKPLSPEDAELEKRKARAARFGIPFIPPVATNGSLVDVRCPTRSLPILFFHPPLTFLLLGSNKAQGARSPFWHRKLDPTLSPGRSGGTREAEKACRALRYYSTRALSSHNIFPTPNSHPSQDLSS